MLSANFGSALRVKALAFPFTIGVQSSFVQCELQLTVNRRPKIRYCVLFPLGARWFAHSLFPASIRHSAFSLCREDGHQPASQPTKQPANQCHSPIMKATKPSTETTTAMKNRKTVKPLQSQSQSQPLLPSSSAFQAPKPPVSKPFLEEEKKKSAKKVKTDSPAGAALDESQLDEALEKGGKLDEYVLTEYSRSTAKAKRQEEEERKNRKGKKQPTKRRRSFSRSFWLCRAPWILSSVLWPLNRLLCLFFIGVCTTVIFRRPIRCLTNKVVPFQASSTSLLCLMESGFMEGLQHQQLLSPGSGSSTRTGSTQQQFSSSSENTPTFITTHVWFDLLFVLQVC